MCIWLKCHCSRPSTDFVTTASYHAGFYRVGLFFFVFSKRFGLALLEPPVELFAFQWASCSVRQWWSHHVVVAPCFCVLTSSFSLSRDVSRESDCQNPVFARESFLSDQVFFAMGNHFSMISHCKPGIQQFTTKLGSGEVLSVVGHVICPVVITPTLILDSFSLHSGVCDGKSASACPSMNSRDHGFSTVHGHQVSGKPSDARTSSLLDSIERLPIHGLAGLRSTVTCLAKTCGRFPSGDTDALAWSRSRVKECALLAVVATHRQRFRVCIARVLTRIF